MRRPLVLVIGALAAMAALTAPAAAVTAAPAAPPAASPVPPLAAAESLIGEGVTVEGPLINNLGLPHLV
ncbi:hypothetical protein ABT390_10420 [Streptomyces aurantiacus]|uniref:Uncharacterized protein n=1 Tax=Streptomyces aurantiacus JA 4570 TaxID=1286094 RepID=S3ZK78_9ACTN|nr:hypothetical protein [Streptomyces aurantiacus]EPH43578.1 hypothetical protein STRAU_3402 [Streptomyces aurantiacus JA 4570]